VERTPRSRRALLAATAALALAGLLLAGCSAGFGATSTQPYAPSDGIQATSGDLKVLNALVVRAETGTDGLVSATIANKGSRDDRLTDVTSPDGTVTLSGDDLLPAGATVRLGVGTDADAEASITGLSKEAGETVRLKFSFRRAEPVTIDTVVVAATGDYADLAPTAVESTPAP
jgi:copper(I)-binding protein